MHSLLHIFNSIGAIAMNRDRKVAKIKIFEKKKHLLYPESTFMLAYLCWLQQIIATYLNKF